MLVILRSWVQVPEQAKVFVLKKLMSLRSLDIATGVFFKPCPKSAECDRKDKKKTKKILGSGGIEHATLGSGPNCT